MSIMTASSTSTQSSSPPPAHLLKPDSEEFGSFSYANEGNNVAGINTSFLHRSSDNSASTSSGNSSSNIPSIAIPDSEKIKYYDGIIFQRQVKKEQRKQEKQQQYEQQLREQQEQQRILNLKKTNPETKKHNDQQRRQHEITEQTKANRNRPFLIGLGTPLNVVYETASSSSLLLDDRGESSVRTRTTDGRGGAVTMADGSTTNNGSAVGSLPSTTTTSLGEPSVVKVRPSFFSTATITSCAPQSSITSNSSCYGDDSEHGGNVVQYQPPLADPTKTLTTTATTRNVTLAFTDNDNDKNTNVTNNSSNKIGDVWKTIFTQPLKKVSYTVKNMLNKS